MGKVAQVFLERYEGSSEPQQLSIYDLIPEVDDTIDDDGWNLTKIEDQYHDRLEEEAEQNV